MASDNPYGVPLGYRFLPTEEELLQHYLWNKTRNLPLPRNSPVYEQEIYGDKEPWNIFSENSSEKFYVFTKLKKKGKDVVGAKNSVRKAGSGTWKHQRTDDVFDCQNNKIGYNKLFVFQVKDRSSSTTTKKGHWLMHEYSFLTDQGDYVLCVIRNKEAKAAISDYKPRPKRRKINSTSIDQQEQQDSISTADSSSIVNTISSSEDGFDMEEIINSIEF